MKSGQKLTPEVSRLSGFHVYSFIFTSTQENKQDEMFGRNFDSSNLLNLITSPNDPGMNSQMLTEFDTSDEELPKSNDPYQVPRGVV